ncbi:Lysophospholipase, alpha-beta hydrolase superfamily [Micromonospora echinaurantiaca]|uniref:Lysophospholipase, alpha-beta hydrolase superfamily n=1 Tax=Micromonospora echinaurantiaca TaxID=47857 RepID=A0A1C5GW67_9ACTN|nr:Lysophospholipase, alpha-beta hydrolase superfamily [Micromonospora echinaurantiaca]
MRADGDAGAPEGYRRVASGRTVTGVEPDVLGPPYERQTIDLGTDDEGPVVATLVRRRAERPTRRAVLYTHGFTDYFFQAHLGHFFAERGWDFYALDLRKHGRSLLPHQTPNFCREIGDYFPELDAAAKIIRDDDGHDTLLAMGHSTGGLVMPLWAHARRDAGIIDGVFLNSPFFDLNAPWLLRRPLAAAAARLGRRAPRRVLPFGLGTVYSETIHADHRGEWQYDLEWKPLAGFPVRAGWLNAIRTGQRQLRAGLDIQVPVLLACSTRSFKGTRWHESAALADAVLDVEHMVRWAPRLGRHVTVARFDGGMHDLTLSGPAVREQVFAEVGRWAEAFLGAGPTDVRPEPVDAGVPGGRRPADEPDPADAAAQSG